MASFATPRTTVLRPASPGQGWRSRALSFNPSVRSMAALGSGDGETSDPATARVRDGCGWVSSCCYAIDQGPVAMMIENHLSGLIWRLLYGSPYIREGLLRAGFSGGWLALPVELHRTAAA